MKKKLMLLMVVLLTAISANAQFEQGKIYTGASLTGLDLSYNGKKGMNLGLQARAGYLLEDNWMVLGQAAFQHTGKDDAPDYFSVGVGARYYIVQNGLFLGANCNFIHANSNYNDLMPGVEVGYAFFLSRTVTVEPSIYYNQSFKKHADYSTIGLKIGVGIYL
ncbi:MAG: hypothetical protein MR536_06485 [Prevotella sp.]|nr:hypothetical protein [Prevotella sp.]MDD7460896.1 hypothetical protein [Prevotellaceae bacterium]MDY3366283.1 hypothetical protein [Prevotella sp.]MDY3852524.1 hypothetical protein [Prevotella sp.]